MFHMKHRSVLYMSQHMKHNEAILGLVKSAYKTTSKVRSGEVIMIRTCSTGVDGLVTQV